MTRVGERVFAWSGGMLFAAALALTAWRYARDFAQPMPGPSLSAIAVNTLWLMVFATHHSVFARDELKQRLERLMPPRLLRPFYVWIASLLLIMVCLAWQPVGGTLYHVTGAARLPLLAVQMFGIVVTLRAVRAIRILEFAGIEPTQTTGTLRVDGPYRLVRHPLYLGWLLAVGGTPHMTGDRLLFFAVTTAYIVAAMPWEERTLTRRFGSVYERYRAQVRWRVVPYVY